MSVEFDIAPFDRRLAHMMEELDQFVPEMGQELTDWQTQDMHRKFPNTKVGETSVSTEIWPHGRGAMARMVWKYKRWHRRVSLRQQQQRWQLRKMVLKKRARGRPPKVVRPILRVELYDKLCDRMEELMSKKLTWK